MKKLLESWKQHLHEIGDAGQEPYDFILDDEESYKFITGEGYEYDVEFAKVGPSRWDITFITRTEGFGSTNEGKPLKVMSTIAYIVKDFLVSIPDEEYPVKFTFDGALKAGEGKEKEGVRTKLYKRYIRSILGKDVEITTMAGNPNYIIFTVDKKPDVVRKLKPDVVRKTKLDGVPWKSLRGAHKNTFPDAVEKIVSKVNAQLQGSGSSIRADVEEDQHEEKMYVIFRPRLKILIPNRSELKAVEKDELDTIPFTNAVVDSIEDFAVALYYDDYKIEAQKTPEGIEVVADFVLDEKVSSLEEAERTAEDIRYHTLSKANKIASSLVKRMVKGGMLKEAKPLSEPKKCIKIKLGSPNLK